jgi:Neuraminidase (sialidase)
MRKKIVMCFAIVASYSLICSNAYADNVLITYDASASTAPTAQGWTDSTTLQGSGMLEQDLGASSWKADGTSGLAQWSYVPSNQNNVSASNNGWEMSWTSRVVSGTYITDYYSNGTKRFLPVLSLDSAGNLNVALEGDSTYTLVSGSGSTAYHDYVVKYNVTTNVATFSFDGTVIDSSWAGQASSQNLITWGNGSSNTDSIANYRKVSFKTLSPAGLSPVAQWDTSALTFDGSSQYLAVDRDIASVQNLVQGSIYTHFQSRGTTDTIFSASDSTDDSSEFVLLINGDGTLRIHSRENGTFVNDSKTTTTYNDNQEHKAVITVNSQGTKIYVDGKLEFTGADTGFISAVTGVEAMNIGRNYDNNGGQWYFSGNIFDTQVYSNVMTEQQASDLTTTSTIVATFDSNTNTNPVSAGWANDSAGSGTGNLVTDQGQSAWQANGTNGRAEWEVVPSLQVNTDATNLGWKMTTTSRVVSGDSITDYYSNGLKRFLVTLSINSNGDLVANVEGGSRHTLVAVTGAAQYHTYETTFDPATNKATFKFDGNVVETWAGSNSSQNVIVWGNGSSGTDGIANYRKARFEILGSGPSIFESVVFQGGQEGVNGTSNYRIPSMVQSVDGTILAFIEGRPSGADPGQGGQINISLKRSKDNGRTWLPVQIIQDVPSGLYDYSDPRPFIDKATNTIYIFYVQWPDLCAQNGNCIGPGDDNFLIYRTSTDNGVTWGTPVDVTSQVKDPTWRSINPGPGQGIQLKWQTTAQGANNGRMIFPAIVRAGNSNFYVATVFSDDSGVTWERGSLTPTSGPTEADMVELSDGRLLLSARNDGGAAGTRYHFLSSDGGETWVQTAHNLAVSKVDIGMTRYSAVRSGDSEDRILVTAPIGTSAGPNRNNLGIWSSLDEGATFGTPHQLVYGVSAYSDVIKMNDGSIGIIYEATGSTLLKFINIELSTIN